jgi:glycosyltransferase involved in cell wall biosynthesis
LKNHITIIIPTRNRLEYLKHSIRTVLTQSYENFTLMVVNNDCTDGTHEYLKNLNDNRIKIVNSHKYLCMTDNFLLGLNSIDKNGWFGIIGDDDGLLPNALNSLNSLINEFNVDIIQCAKDYYRWNDISGSNIKGGSIIINRIFNKKPSYKKSYKNIIKCIYGEIDPLDYPRFYTGGFASTTLLSKFLNQDQHFIRSSIPDIYSSVVIGLNTERYLWSPKPLVVSGTSKSSNGISHFNRPNNPNTINSTTNGFGAIPVHPKISMNEFFFPNDNSVILLESLYYYCDKNKFSIDMNKFIYNLTLRISRSDIYSQLWVNKFVKENLITLNYNKNLYGRAKYFIKIIPSRYIFKCKISNSNNFISNVYDASLIINNFRNKNFLLKTCIYLLKKIESLLSKLKINI